MDGGTTMAATRVYFATNREEVMAGEVVTGFGPALNPKSPLWLRYGAVGMEKARKGNAYRIADLFVAPENIPNTPGAADEVVLRGSDAVYEGLRRQLVAQKGRADVVLMLHGYACEFENSMSNAAEIKEALSTAAKPLEVAMFSWPADGAIVPFISYASDRDDARSSAKAIARALQRFLAYLAELERRVRAGEMKPEELCRANIHLIAHSMGNYALRNALQALISDYGGRTMPRVFKTIFLMAADEDNDAFEHDTKLARLPELAEQVCVYFARNDGALVISDVSKGNPDRLGATGPRTLTSLPQKVTLIDCTDVSVTRPLTDANHQYYRKRAEVQADMRQVIAGLRPEAIANREWVAARNCFRIKASRK
jgi:esterase/lipase superfamily enzyme